MNPALQLIILILLFFAWIVSLFGYGSFFATYVLKKYPIHKYLIWNYGIFGFIIIFVLTSLINIFIPISSEISIAILFVGIVMTSIHLITNKIRIQQKFSILALFFGVLFLFYCTVYNWIHGTDTGLYHLPAIKWMIEYPIPLGLANLHGRLGFNCAWLPISAMIDQSVIWFNRPVFIINAILFFFYSTLVTEVIQDRWSEMSSSSLKGIVKQLQGGLNPLSAHEMFLLLSILPVIFESRFYLSNPSPDYPVFILTLVQFFFLIKMIEEKTDLYDFCTWAPFILALFSTAIKLSAVIMIPMTLLAVFIRIINLNHIKNSGLFTFFTDLKTMLRSIPEYCYLIFFLLTIPLIIRGILLSGNPIYPLSYGSLSFFPWSVSAQQTKAEADAITGWARLPGPNYMESLGTISWMNEWFHRIITTPRFFLCIGLIIVACIVTLIFLYNIYNSDIILDWNNSFLIMLYPLLVTIVGLLFWFVSAPEPRFGIGFLYSFPLLLFVYPFLKIKYPNPRLSNTWKKYFIMGCIIFSGITFLGLYQDTGLLKINEKGLLPSMPDMNVSAHITNDGETIFVPPSELTDQVWNAPLPNTPDFDPTIKIIKDPKNGFYTMFYFETNSQTHNDLY
ncbi:LIC_10190 family membrane protein [Methanospirillum lacunae]|uniref:DUF8201 domain-containing protein n=1 Tax=Methanospirillum lacunae TaxID=668570 RepID=A0A2V2N5W6_9EURY|nr:hypothetical protein [Methanospirillum lacunae]PWR70683.1 hypothetical protein DK846_13820 [Methanospirillum lacunae]